MSHYTGAEYPRLELFFEDDGKRLKDSSFYETSASRANHKLAEYFFRGEFVRELCIFMLLAKYHGPFKDDPDKKIEFKENSDRVSWLKALGVSLTKDTHRKTLKECFGNTNFITSSRGSDHNKKRAKGQSENHAFANFHPSTFRLHNIHVLKVGRDGKISDAVEAADDEIALIAEALEKSVPVVKWKKNWEPTVRERILQIDADRPPAQKQSLPEKASETSNSQASSILVYEKPQKMWDMVNVNIQSQIKGGFWYYVGSTLHEKPNITKSVGEDILRHGSIARLGCTSAEYFYDSPVNLMKEAFSNCRNEFESNAREKGYAMFYGTQYSCHCEAILFVPFHSEESKTAKQFAPIGTWCAVETNLIGHWGDRQTSGLYLHLPSAMLDIYYNKLTNLFETATESNLPLIEIVRPDS
jgi:hypothetical protein